MVSDIAFSSLCEHHLLPFVGVAHIGYLPGDRSSGSRSCPGWSSTARARLQVQERLTTEIADWLEGTCARAGSAW